MALRVLSRYVRVFPVTEEAKTENGIAEIALHKGKQVSRTKSPHYCEECGITWKIDFSEDKDPVVTMGSCSSGEVYSKLNPSLLGRCARPLARCLRHRPDQ